MIYMQQSINLLLLFEALICLYLCEMIDFFVQGANMKLREGNRERLLNGVENLHKADNQIDRIKGVAIETHGVMIDANRELKDQGHLIDSAQEKVDQADASTTRTKKRVVQMTRKEYWYKFVLYILIVLLFLGDVASIISFAA